ncbi:MAG: phosphatidylinositol mannoside acyltransferase [Acidimicrobiales bacterium]
MPDRAPGRAAYLAYRSLATVVQALPAPVAAAAGRMAGFVMSELWSDRRLVRANMARVLGPGVTKKELDHAVAEAFSSYAQYWIESAQLARMAPAEVMKRFSIEGWEPAEEALRSGRGAIFALPHLGSWEIGGLWLTLQGHPMTTVVEPLQPPELFEWFKDQRSALGLQILSLGRETSGALVQTLREGRLVGLVADRDLVGNGIEVEFFGERTRLPGGPAVLALRTGAPLFPVAVYQCPGGQYRGVIRPELDCERSGRFRADVEALTGRLAREFEQLIRAAPTQWHLFQPNWPSDRSVEHPRHR